MLYYVIMCMPVGNADQECEYTGTYYRNLPDAREELRKAINDVNVDCAWIERTTKDLELDYKEA